MSTIHEVVFRSGEKAPFSGIYVTARGLQVALTKGERFPPSRTGWRLHAEAKRQAVDYPRVEELTTRQAVEDAHVVERGFDVWWRDQGPLRSRTGRPDCGAAFRAGFDLARQLFLRESLTDPGSAPEVDIQR